MNWNPPEAFYKQLLDENAITSDQLKAIQRDLGLGSTPTTALMNNTDNEAVWRIIARQYRRKFFPRQQEVRVFFTDLMDYETVLSTQLLPQRTSGNYLHVLTHNPTIEPAPHPHPKFAGMILDPRLITPTLWRSLYAIGYPKAIVRKDLSEAEATALVTLTELGSEVSVTPNQNAEIQAIAKGYNYIDPRIEPPNQSVQDMISLSSKTLYKCYPHHMQSSGLVVMMVNPDNKEAIRQLQFQSQCNIIPAITTQTNIELLILKEQGSASVDNFFEQLGL